GVEISVATVCGDASELMRGGRGIQLDSVLACTLTLPQAAPTRCPTIYPAQQDASGYRHETVNWRCGGPASVKQDSSDGGNQAKQFPQHAFHSSDVRTNRRR